MFYLLYYAIWHHNTTHDLTCYYIFSQIFMRCFFNLYRLNLIANLSAHTDMWTIPSAARLFSMAGRRPENAGVSSFQQQQSKHFDQVCIGRRLITDSFQNDSQASCQKLSVLSEPALKVCPTFAYRLCDLAWRQAAKGDWTVMKNNSIARRWNLSGYMELLGIHDAIPEPHFIHG